MDPLPSHHGKAASETWSVASSSIIDTQSEPPCTYGKQADRIMKGVATTKTTTTAAPSPPPGSTLGAKLNNVTNKSSARNDQQPREPGGSFRSKASTATSGGRSKKSRRSQHSTGNGTRKSSSSSKTSNKQRSSGWSKQATSVASRDPSCSLSSYHPGQPLAIVPVSRDRDLAQHQQHQQSGVDPPESASTSGSSSSTAEECSAPTLYDPPTSNGTSSDSVSHTYASSSAQGSRASSSRQSRGSEYSYASNVSSSIQSSHRHRGPPPQSSSSNNNNEQLAVWNEECSDEEESGYVARERRDGTTVGSGSGTRSSSSSYYSDEESGTPVENALALREDSRSEGGSEDSSDEDEGDEEENARAIVARDDYGGVNSYYSGDGEEEEGGGNNDGQIVEHEGKKGYLASAVDNYNAIVPIDSAIYEAYDHTFVTCPENLRFRFLYTFLKKNMDKKVMIFFSTTNSVKFHARLLEHFHVPVLTMHGKQRREKFIQRFFKFSDLDEGILCATDAAGRDLDIPPSVDWVIQFEPPDDPSEYILRVARISCDSDRVGRSLLFLNPGETGFLKYYHSASIPVSEFEIPVRSLADVQGHIEYHVNENERLLRSARDAYGSYLIAYASHGFRDVYNVHDLNKSDVATAFGLVGGIGPDDDMTAETDTLADYTYVGGAELGGERRGSGGGGGSNGRSRTWEKKEKPKSKSWMRGEKSWPHSQIKLHPKFTGKGNTSSAPEQAASGAEDKGRTRDYLWA